MSGVSPLTREILEPLAAQRLSTYEIADRLNTTQSAVWSAMQRHGIKCRGKSGGKNGSGKDYIPGQLSPNARAIRFDAAEEKQWQPIGVWPEHVAFTSLNFKPSPVLKPRGVEERSWCGCASGDCAALGEAA